jgi:hypothetical protein
MRLTHFSPAAVLALTLLLPTSASAQTTATTVMTGLDNPRGLAIGPEGGLYVAEAGHGGTGPCVVIRPPTPTCIGPSGAISRWWHGTQQRIVTGLPSAITGADAGGPHRISFQGRGNMYVTMGGGGTAALRESLGAGAALFGWLVKITPDGTPHPEVDLLAYEVGANPDGGAIESNAFGALAEPGSVFVTDAAGNSLLQVEPRGNISTLAVFPSRVNGRSTDAVPTSVARGPDGALYVSELTGVPFALNAARIYRVVEGSAPAVYLTNFTTVIDLAFGPDGSLYVLEHSTGPAFFAGAGRITRVSPTGVRTIVVAGLDRPTSLVVDGDGAIYVTNHGISMGAGEVIKVVTQ